MPTREEVLRTICLGRLAVSCLYADGINVDGIYADDIYGDGKNAVEYLRR
jgi:hypothetical protein